MPKLPATVAMIMLLVKVRRDLSSAFVNLDSAGMDKIAEVMKITPAHYVSPFQKRFKQRPGVLVLTVINQCKLTRSFC